ncbi:PQQ-binding-like beta-propeller repeat protein [Candidatus Binatus sp.]|uniref:outer membrane protein assembly factor BamB family protein n=1 Tax=Candidatus Binatus sp. TaxID=2811406 RepID=UPI003C6F8E03
MFHHDRAHTGRSQFNTSSNNGKLKWAFATDGAVVTAPAIGADGTIYIGSDDHNLYAVKPDGTRRWKFETGNNVQLSSPAIGSDGTIYFGSDDGNLYAVSPDGTQKWKFATGGTVESSPAIGTDGTIYFWLPGPQPLCAAARWRAKVEVRNRR